MSERRWSERRDVGSGASESRERYLSLVVVSGEDGGDGVVEREEWWLRCILRRTCLRAWSLKNMSGRLRDLDLFVD